MSGKGEAGAPLTGERGGRAVASTRTGMHIVAARERNGAWCRACRLELRDDARHPVPYVLGAGVGRDVARTVQADRPT